MSPSLSLVEYVPRRGVRLSVDQRDALLGLVPGLMARPEVGTSDVYTLVNGSTVGVVQVGDLIVELQPKVGPAAVLFMLSYELDERAWRAASAQLEVDTTLTEAIAAIFVRLTSEAVQHGLLHDYQQRDDSLSTIRGRVRIADQIRARRGLPLPTEVTYDEYTSDIIENRIIRTAVGRLRRQRLRSQQTVDRLARLDAIFTEVSLIDTDAREIQEPNWTRLNERYRPAVNLARLVLNNGGLEARVGTHSTEALLIDMNVVFERFVRVALREALHLAPVEFPSPNKLPRRYLDRSRQVPLLPDLSWWADGACLLVADCKYKRPTGSVPNADVYQMLAYLTEFELNEGWLVYASGEVQPADLALRHAEKTVHVRAIDAAKKPAALLEDVRALAREFAQSAAGVRGAMAS